VIAPRLPAGRLPALLAAAVIALGASPAPDLLSPQPDDMALGRASAPVTVVEYASAGCPHCAAWANDVFPAFKAKYVDTGMVRFVVREELAGDPNLAAAGFLTARCAGGARYFEILDYVFKAQALIVESRDLYGPLSKIALDAGIPEARFKVCLGDAAAAKALQDRADRHVDVDKVPSTPTFLVNQARLEGEQTLAELDRAIARARRR
jgi:protein-disulfide isomerase